MYGMTAFLSGILTLGLFKEPDPELPSPWVYLTIFVFCIIMMFLDKYRSENRKLTLWYGICFWSCLFNMLNQMHLNEFGFWFWIGAIGVVCTIIAWTHTVYQQIQEKKHSLVEIESAQDETLEA